MRPLLAAVAAAAVLASGCTGEPGEAEPGPARIDVDTPELREAKDDARVEPCRPGTGDTPVDGGLPDVTLPCFGGGRDIALGSLRGPLVVNLWASWCGPCRREMPVLQRFHEEHGDRVPIIGVDYEDPQTGAAMDLVRETGVTYPLLADPQSELQGAGPFPGMMGLPMFAFVDEDGRAVVVAQQVREVGDLEDLVEEKLGVTL